MRPITSAASHRSSCCSPFHPRPARRHHDLAPGAAEDVVPTETYAAPATYSEPQYVAPQYSEPQYVAPQYSEPVVATQAEPVIGVVANSAIRRRVETGSNIPRSANVMSCGASNGEVRWKAPVEEQRAAQISKTERALPRGRSEFGLKGPRHFEEFLLRKTERVVPTMDSAERAAAIPVCHRYNNQLAGRHLASHAVLRREPPSQSCHHVTLHRLGAASDDILLHRHPVVCHSPPAMVAIPYKYK